MLRYALGLGLTLMSLGAVAAEERQGAVAEVMSLNTKLEAAIARGDPGACRELMRSCAI